MHPPGCMQANDVSDILVLPPLVDVYRITR